MRVGTMFLGEVEALEGESIQTKFLIIGVPLAPLESVYVTADGPDMRGITLDLHGTSVVAGYLRLGSALVAVVAGVFAWIGWRSWDPQWGYAALSATATAAWLASLLVLGRLSDGEKQRRRRLRRATGIGAPPDVLPAHVREDLAGALDARWASLGLGDWRERLQSGDAVGPELDLLYALAEYHGDRDLAQFATLAMAQAV